MKVAIFSDLHLCSDDRICEFSHDEAEFCALIESIRQTHDQLLVPGDVFNLDHGLLPLGRGLELAAARRRFPRLTAMLAQADVAMVFGNHDRGLGRLGNVPEIVRLELAGRQIAMLHGHQFDGRLKQLPMVSATGSWLAGWMRRLDNDTLADLLVRIGWWANRLSPGPKPKKGGPTRDVVAARQVLDRTGADVVVMGHTHRPVCHRFDDGRVYVNPGACSFGALQWASLDLTTLECELNLQRSPAWLPGTESPRDPADVEQTRA